MKVYLRSILAFQHSEWVSQRIDLSTSFLLKAVGKIWRATRLEMVRVRAESKQSRPAQTSIMKQSRVCFAPPLTAGVCVGRFAAAVERKPGQVHRQWRHCVLKPPRCAAVSCNVSRQDTGGMWRQRSRDTDCSRERGSRRSRSIIFPGAINKPWHVSPRSMGKTDERILMRGE